MIYYICRHKGGVVAPERSREMDITAIVIILLLIYLLKK